MTGYNQNEKSTWLSKWNALGPGILMASAAVGGSHIVKARFLYLYGVNLSELLCGYNALTELVGINPARLARNYVKRHNIE